MAGGQLVHIHEYGYAVGQVKTTIEISDALLERAKVIRALAASGDPWAIPWPCVYELFSVVTNRRI